MKPNPFSGKYNLVSCRETTECLIYLAEALGSNSTESPLGLLSQQVGVGKFNLHPLTNNNTPSSNKYDLNAPPPTRFSAPIMVANRMPQSLTQVEIFLDMWHVDFKVVLSLPCYGDVVIMI
jgi:hypothetical protein